MAAGMPDVMRGAPEVKTQCHAMSAALKLNLDGTSVTSVGLLALAAMAGSLEDVTCYKPTSHWSVLLGLGRCCLKEIQVQPCACRLGTNL